MKTILDTGHTWFLYSISYSKGVLTILLQEGMKATSPQDLEIIDGVVIENVFAINPSASSRFVRVNFSRCDTWQLVQEHLSHYDENELKDDKSFLQILEKSEYFSYVNKCHSNWVTTEGQPRHFRVWTENEVIDVVSVFAPSIEQLTMPNMAVNRDSALKRFARYLRR